jgi:hypothetical protein
LKENIHLITFSGHEINQIQLQNKGINIRLASPKKPLASALAKQSRKKPVQNNSDL